MSADQEALTLEPLVVAAANGDVDAFGRLVSATSALVSSIALAIVRDLELSRDVSQDVFLAAWRDLRTLRNPSSFLPWLRQMTRNRAHHSLRTRIRLRRREGDEMTDAGLDEVADPRPTPVDLLAAAEDAHALAEALESLPDETREIVLLYYREDRSTKQVAALLDLSDEAVKKRLSRARAALREALLDRAGDFARRTAPGAAFTAAVVASLSFVAPSTAAAATMAASKAGAPAAAGLAAKVAAVFGGAAIGGASGGGSAVVGVVYGVRQLQREARDAEERRALKRFGAAVIAVVIAASAMFPIGWALAPRAWKGWTQVAVFDALMVALMAMYLGWLPRIVARRLAAERREDPEHAPLRQARQHRLQIVLWIFGLLGGTAFWLFSLWFWSRGVR